MEQSEITRSQSERRSPRGFLRSIQSQVLLALGFVLFLTLAIVAVGYVGLRGVQANATDILERATQIRELSLEIENEFFLARQSEAAFLNQWRSLGFELAEERYVSANQEHITSALEKLDELERVADEAEDPIFGGMLTNVEELRPLLEEYQQEFLQTVENISERSRPEGLEMSLRQQLNDLEQITSSLENPTFLELILRIQINEYAYLDIKQLEYVDQVQLLVNQFKDLVEQSSAQALAVAPSELVTQIDNHLTTFESLVTLEREIENEITIFRNLTSDIRGYTDQIIAIGESGLIQSRARLAQANRRSLWALILAGGLALSLGAGSSVYITRRISRPVTQMSEAAQRLGQGDLEQTVERPGVTELDALAEAFNAMASRLRSLIDSLERQVRERTQDLGQRVSQLRATTEVGRAIATIRDSDELLSQVTELISEYFDFYHVGIFLVDESGEYAVLRAANSPGGQEMLAAGHRLAVGEQGIVGYVTDEQETRIALDVDEDAGYFDNPYLPETRSEIALPLVVGERLLGALDVQSREPEAFSPDDVEVLRGLADQVATAIENARLFVEAQEALEAERRAYGEIGAEAWASMIVSRDIRGYLCDVSGVKPVEGNVDLSTAMEETEELSPLSLPIEWRGRVIGHLHARKAGDWTSQEETVLENLREQLSSALESARLYEDTQRRAAREQLTSDVTARIRESLDLETVLRTAASEMRRALDLEDLVVQLRADDSDTDAVDL